MNKRTLAQLAFGALTLFALGYGFARLEQLREDLADVNVRMGAIEAAR